MRCASFFLAGLLLAAAATPPGVARADAPGRDSGPIDETLPAITAGPALTLREALEGADRRNLSLAVARGEIEKARARLGFAWARNAPMLGAQVGATHNDQADLFDPVASLAPVFQNLGLPVPDSDPLTVRPQNVAQLGVQLSVPIVNVEAWKGVGAAKLGVELSELTIENLREQLLLTVAQAYWITVVQKELVAIQESQIHAAADHLAIARARLEAGDGIRIDVVRAETELERARQDLLTAHLGLDNSRDALGTLVGVKGLPLPVDPPELPVPGIERGAPLNEVVAGRSDLRAGELGVELSRRQLELSWMRFLPTLSTGAQATYLFTDPPDLGASERGRWALFVTLSVPLYSQLHYADLDARRAELRQAKARVEQLESQAELEVRKAQRDYLASLSVSATAERQATLAHEALELTDAAYRDGATTSLEVSDARRTARNAEVNAATQRLRSQMALLSLLRSLGEDLVAAAAPR